MSDEEKEAKTEYGKIDIATWQKMNKQDKRVLTIKYWFLV